MVFIFLGRRKYKNHVGSFGCVFAPANLFFLCVVVFCDTLCACACNFGLEMEKDEKVFVYIKYGCLLTKMEGEKYIKEKRKNIYGKTRGERERELKSENCLEKNERVD